MNKLQKMFVNHKEMMSAKNKTILKDIESTMIPVPAQFGEYGFTLMNSVIAKYKPWDERYETYDTVLGAQALYNIQQFDGIAPEGVAIECGVYRGGVSRLLLDLGREVYSLDTFEGMIGSDDYSIIDDGEFKVDEESVAEYLKGANLVKGDIFNTLPRLAHVFKHELAFVHLDMDMEAPTSFALNVLFPLLSDGGVIVLDDYGNWMTPGVKIAVDNFRNGKKIYLPTGQMVIIK